MSLFIAMCLYSFSMSITPGPVNLISFSAGVNFGFKRALSFILGATIGFTLLLYLVGLGLSQTMGSLESDFMLLLGLLGAGFIFYMGLKVFQSEGEVKTKDAKPPKFLFGFMLQWLNPKAWLASLAGISAFGLVNDHPKLLMFISVYFVLCFIGIASWGALGNKLRDWINSPAHLKRLNQLMGLLLMGVAVYLLVVQSVTG